jgi:hypothetical protein
MTGEPFAEEENRVTEERRMCTNFASVPADADVDAETCFRVDDSCTLP